MEQRTSGRPGAPPADTMLTGARPPWLEPPRDASLRARWADLRRQRPGTRARDAALALGVSEAALLSSTCGDGITRLQGPWGEVVAGLPALGPVQATTRNALAVHEKRGGYARVDIRGMMGLVLNDAINLRLFFGQWASGFAVREGRRRSLEFFDHAGHPVHKVFLEPDARGGVYDTLVARHAHGEQGIWDPPRRLALVASAGPPPEGIVFRDRWALAHDPEDADTLITAAGLTRRGAFRLLAPSWAHPVARTSLQRLLAAVVADRTPITLGVGNAGAFQRHTGPLHRVYATGRWLNVRDTHFHLRLCVDRVATTWVVKAPSRDGLVTTLELLDAAGATVLTAGAARWPGQMEPERWRLLVTRLPVLASDPAPPARARLPH